MEEIIKLLEKCSKSDENGWNIVKVLEKAKISSNVGLNFSLKHRKTVETALKNIQNALKMKILNLCQHYLKIGWSFEKITVF